MQAAKNRAFLAPGDRIGRYEIVAEIATGGMAVVYVARLTSFGGFDKLVAVKLMLPHLIDDRDHVDMFMDEARIVASIHHPNVVQVFELGEHEGTPFLVMELLRGKSLAQLVRRAGKEGVPIEPAVSLFVCEQAARGLHAAHETRDQSGKQLGIVHRDVSPQNIHVGYDGHVRVVDFGIAAAVGKIARTRTDELKGKLEYLAPEQLAKGRLGPHTDVWALAVVTWELLMNDRLFKDRDDASTLFNVLNKRIAPLGRDLPEPVHRVIEEALERDVDLRLASARELADAFQDAYRGAQAVTQADVARLMEHLFPDDQAIEASELAQAVEDRPNRVRRAVDASEGEPAAGEDAVGGDPSRRESGPSPAPARGSSTRSAGTVSASVPVSASGSVSVPVSASVSASESESASRAPLLPILALVALTLAIGYVAYASGVFSNGAAETTTAAQEPVEEPVPADPDHAPPPTEITLGVDPDARLVLVDGVRRDERPLVIDVTDGGAMVELVAPDGRVIERRVTSEDDGASLSLPRPGRARSRRRGRAMRRGPMTMNEATMGMGEPGILRSEEVF